MNMIDKERLEQLCLEVRRDIIEMLHTAKSGHPGGSLSAVEILVLLYFLQMNIRPEEPGWPSRDKFILSKGHAAPLLYAILAERGYFPKETLSTFNAPGSTLQKHIDMHMVPGAELSTGSLGQGLSAGLGMALCDRMEKRDSYVYVLLGDGEVQEGQVWEAALCAAQYKADHLICFLDNNGCQVDGYTRDVCQVEPVSDKWAAFRWDVRRINGHDLEEIDGAIKKAKLISGQPHMIIADTIKGKGISFMENNPDWHARSLTEDEYTIARQELAGEKWEK